MNINSNHVIGFVAGAAVMAGGFYLYKKNQVHVDKWLRQQGINIPSHSTADPATMSLEELVTQKENFEDIIAEREMAADSDQENS
ncbi:MAG: hypothetical protein HKP41_21965 [Desulfobacterales bacterium]|nr:hypothetical protein [Deltaproteobacteria bacterium]NNK97030.1 hypothetical protein [Desulfobacterales bacterium]